MDPITQDVIYNDFGKDLYRLNGDAMTDSIMDMLSADPQANNSSMVAMSPSDIGSGVTSNTTQSATGSSQSGKTTFDNTVTGYILGVDPKDGFAKLFIGNTTSYVNWTGTALNIKGSISTSSIDIPDAVTANSFHVDSSGNTWWGATSLGSSIASVLNTGAATFTNLTVNGTFNFISQGTAKGYNISSDVYISKDGAINTTQTQTPAEVERFTMSSDFPVATSVSVTYKMATAGGGGNVLSNIYKNGVAIGTQRSTDASIVTSAIYTETISSFGANDVLAIYGWNDSPAAYTGQITLFRILGRAGPLNYSIT